MRASDRESYEKRIERAKKIAALVVPVVNGPRGALMPADLKAALLDACSLLIELAQLSHGQFDMHPFDIRQLTHRVDVLDGLTGREIIDG